MRQRDSNLVLVVDDSVDSISYLNEVLTQASMTPLVALDGEQAISIAHSMIPDLILLDALMPKLDGFETCKQMKSSTDLKSIPVIFMTGLKDTESIVKGFEAGGADYLTKPIDPKELIARLNVHLMNARTALSSRTALDVAGQNIFAVDNNGDILWATPRIEKLLLQLEKNQQLDHLKQTISTWLKHSPEIGNRMNINFDDHSLKAIFFGISKNDELMIRLIDEEQLDEKSIIKKNFPLTAREVDVLLWIAKGKTNREIAAILSMSPRTVSKHVEQLFKKLEVDNRTTAATMAIQCLLNFG